jgi:RecJ-like exonuclease
MDWRTIPCDRCNGHGVVAVYSASDFDGADFCPLCGGSGETWVSPKGRIADYPGGPFRGRVERAEFAREGR